MASVVGAGGTQTQSSQVPSYYWCFSLTEHNQNQRIRQRTAPSPPDTEEAGAGKEWIWLANGESLKILKPKIKNDMPTHKIKTEHQRDYCIRNSKT